MRYYTLQEREKVRWSGGYDMGRRWALPGVSCPMCSAQWGGGGYDYPAVDLSGLGQVAKLLERPRNVPWAEFAALRDSVLPLVPQGAVVTPGSGFGPLTGRARGQFGPISVHMPWTLLVRPDVMRLLDGLTGAVAVPAAFRRVKSDGQLLELQVMPGGRLVGEDRHKPCETCGRSSWVLPPPARWRLAAPPSTDFARATATVVVVSERVVERLERQLEESDIVALDVSGPRGAKRQTDIASPG
ncbi:double-CXXCG motif protein [Myxococcus sp. K15C18031901]|uniref:SitI6 family double-CXXCG motif immunity protein n=1 Tax=Myxococcus dinghuensis TaxID=2906761 RepID=UPI0020A7B1EF|nr:double-CXXCG motif protein [Myxococcus dinghuensis]MCP3101665.1 double-CXXCG motif protein [Myxococcus dinghuensis]